MAEIAETLRLGQDVNVGRNERIASVLGGAGLLLLGLRQRGAAGALLGAAGTALLHRGASGHCFAWQALGVDTSDARYTRRALPADEPAPASVTATISVNRSPTESYAFWRDFRNAPRYMNRISKVEILDEVRSRWTATGPMGRSWTWESEVVEDRPGELIAWESLPGADLPNRGWVQFLPSPQGATDVRYFVEFDPPGGIIGDAIASVFHSAPKEMVRGDLRRFRQLLETGELTTTAGQPSGRERWVDDGA